MSFVSVERHEGGVAVVTIENPPVNQLSSALIAELEATLEKLEVDPEIRALVLTGAGERAFAAGADIKEFVSNPAAVAPEDELTPLQLLGLRMDESRLPVVAAIRGFCLGGGLELAISCDVRVCTEDAQLGQPEVKLGLIPGGGGTQRLPRLIGPGRTLLLTLSGEPVDGRTAYAWGLVEQVVPAAELLERALEIARSIARVSPHAVATVRRLALKTRDLALRNGLEREAAAFRRCLASEDGIEGVAAFLGKRSPVFTGR